MKPTQWVKTPKGYVSIALVALLAVASIAAQDMKGIALAMVAVAAAVAVDVICCLIEKRKRIMPDGAAITGLIVSMVLSTSTPWYVVAATAILAILSKHILTYKKKPIFNPAAVGLLLSIPVFHTQQSWWGAFGDLPAWLLLLVLIGGYAVANRIHKFPQVFAFLGTYLILLFVLGMGVLPVDGGMLQSGALADALRPPFINATLFFALFMLTDPPTSPAKVKEQIAFGILAAAVGAVVYAFFGGLSYLFIGLLAGNLSHAFKAISTAQASKQVRPAVKANR